MLNWPYEISNDPEKAFHSEYRFFIDHAVKPQERLNAVDWKESAGKIDQTEDTRKETIEQFSKQIGTVTFVFNEKTATGRGGPTS
jgi:hypothetical protein